MTITHGFTLLKEQEIPELNAMAKLYRHSETGAELLSVETDDDNKVFGITFRTPPEDSTGLPHIMEHSVLCGSRKYPVKEPFIELAKSSLKTFLNAMTYSDKTCYPVASQNPQDFYNLVDVYLDAVFHPRITPETLQQEGWHYELDELDAPLVYKGVVFNEMKGAYSSPDNLVYRYSERVLFPDTTYGLDSGGDPQVIPELTYAQFKTFHETYYHPSNARIFFYGDDDPEERLRLVQEYLKEYQACAVDSAVELQPRFDEPKRVTYPYPAGEDEENQKTFLTLNWLLSENTGSTQTYALQILGYILMGTPASPLRKALIDSGLGEKVIGGGLDDELRQLRFSTGLKGIRAQHVDQVEQLILDTLEELADKGIDPDMVEAALNTIEFRLREQNFGSYPRGLVMMLQSLTTWLHDGDPFVPLAFEAPLAEIKACLASDPRYFESLIQEQLLENPHRVTLILEPDPQLRQTQEAEERERLDTVQAAMTDADVQAVIESTRHLKQLQNAPDSPEALATIPRLQLEDLDKEVRKVPLEATSALGAPVLYHDLFTNGILYLDVGFNMHTLPADLLPYMPLFGASLLGIGTETEDFVKLTQRIGRETGGIRHTIFTSAFHDAEDAAVWSFLRGKTTVAQSDELFTILRDVLLTVKLDNQERFKQMLLEAKAGLESRLVPAGHSVVFYRLRSKFDVSHWAREQLSGVSALFFLRGLMKQVEQDWPAVLEKLEAIRSILINRNAMLCNVTLDSENWASVQPKLDAFLTTLPAHPVEAQTWSPTYTQFSEGLTIPAKVNYVAKGGAIYDLGYTLDGSLAVITNYLRSTWLWEKIRIQGGAYGAFCVFDQHTGIFGYGSYRDPNLLETLDNYDQSSTFLKNLDLSQDELTKSIIGAIGRLDAYQLPDAKGYSSMARHLIGYTDAMRQQFRDEVLSTTQRDFRDFAPVLERLNDVGKIVVLGSADAIQEANVSLSEELKITKVL